MNKYKSLEGILYFFCDSHWFNQNPELPVGMPTSNFKGSFILSETDLAESQLTNSLILLYKQLFQFCFRAMVAFPELHSQTEIIFYYDDHLLPRDRTKGIGNVKYLNTEEQEICNIGSILVGWWKEKRLGIFHLSLWRGIIGSKVFSDL